MEERRKWYLDYFLRFKQTKKTEKQMINENEQNEIEVKPVRELKYEGEWNNYSLKMLRIGADEIEVSSRPDSILINGSSANAVFDDLGKFAFFPAEFLRKLPTSLQAEIVKNRLEQDAVKNKDLH